MTISDGVKALALYLGSTFRADIDSLQLRAYQRALEGIPNDVLLEAADRLVNAAAGGQRFFPVPTAPDVKRHAAAVLASRRAAAAKRALAVCQHDGGWTPVVDAEGVERLRRCPCWRAAQDAMAAVGQPIALPPSREEVVE